MVRYAVPIVLACLYVAGSTWLVSNEGRAYRESLRRERPDASPAPAPTSEADRPSETSDGEGAIPETPEPRREPAPPESTPVPETSPPRPVAEENARPSPAALPGPSPPSRAPGPPAGSVTPPHPDERTARITQWKNDPFWSQPVLVKSWDLDHFTAQDERQLGEQLNRLILQLNPEDSGPGLRRVKETARGVLRLINPKEREYQFFVLNSQVANAFSHPGGYVYLSRELLKIIPEDDQPLLEFVLAHEIAHVELHHALACLNAPDVRKFGDGTLQKLYFLIIPHGYPDEFEYAADVWAYNKLKQLHRSEHDCLKFLRILDNYAKTHGFENGRGKLEDLAKERRDRPKGEHPFSPVDNHLRSHPATYDRLNHLKERGAAARP